MYGRRDATHAWQGNHTELLGARGLCGRTASPALCHNEERFTQVQGDEFAVMANPFGIQNERQIPGDVYDFKLRRSLVQTRQNREKQFSSTGCSFSLRHGQRRNYVVLGTITYSTKISAKNPDRS